MVEPKQLVVVGNGMVGHRLIELLVEAGLTSRWRVTVIGEEPRAAYDRLHLSEFFAGRSAEALSLAPTPGWYADQGVDLQTGLRITRIDRSRSCVVAGEVEIAYDRLILATGSVPFVPPIPGAQGPGCHVYRTIEDLIAIRAAAAGARTGVVVGGGLLGLEAAHALVQLGLQTHVVEFAPRLMSVQLDEAGGSMLRRKIESMGVRVHTGKTTSGITTAAASTAAVQSRMRLTFADQSELATDLVVFSAGIRPRDDLARASGLGVGERGGITIDDRCRTSDPAISAIGECAAWNTRIYGLVAPGYHMARVVADDLLAAAPAATFTGFDMSTKLKLMGVDVASFGDAHGTTPGCHSIQFADTTSETYKKLVVSADRTRLLGGILVGEAGAYGQLLQIMLTGMKLPLQAEDLILPVRTGQRTIGLQVTDLPDASTICSCHNVSKRTICASIQDGRFSEIGQIKSCTKAGTGCGSCVPLLKTLLHHQMKQAGMVVNDVLCEHFPYTRQALNHLVRVQRITNFDELITRHGTGRGCAVCKPTVASILASTWNEHVLETRHAHLQDTNDRYLANIQRDGSYSVVPRVAGGEITPDQLIALGRVAKAYGLYSKITGGQRVDLFGARLEQLPDIWQELIAAGFESGHAYGKALRTVKSCVGSSWCRYGVQDSVGLAIRLEHRYKGLRSPHKLKAACSGCARECAEAQSKDFGIIATEKGYNLYLCGNGGMKPQHGSLFATDLSEAEVMRYVDRFLMFYVRTADRLERTATWFTKLDGGIDYLRQVIIQDSLGICAELEAEMAHVISTYQDEWRTVVEDPAKRAQFRAFINTEEPDPSIIRFLERGQMHPLPRRASATVSP